MRFIPPKPSYHVITAMLMLLMASMFGYVEAAEIHKNGFGGVTPFNTTGLSIFNESLKRSVDYEPSGLAFSSDFSILENNGDLRDFSSLDTDFEIFGSPNFNSALYGTGIYLNNSQSQYLQSRNSVILERENSDVTIIWWGSFQEIGKFHRVMGYAAADATTSYRYGFVLQPNNTFSFLTRSDTTSLSAHTGFEISINTEYAIGFRWDDSGSDVNLTMFVNGTLEYEIYGQSVRIGAESGDEFYIGRTISASTTSWLNGTTDEALVINEAIENSTMSLITTRQHDIVISSGPTTTTQGFGGLFLALPWLIVFGLLGWLFFVIFMAWKRVFD